MRIEDIDREFRELSRSLKEAQQAFRSGNFAQAEPLYLRALELSERSYGDEHPDTCTCLQNLADTYYSLRRYKDAVPLLRRLLITREKQYGVAHAEVAGVLFKLAKAYEKQGQPQEAESIYRRALRVGEQVYGKESTFVATVLESFAAMLKRAQMRLQEVEQMEERVRDLREKLGHHNKITSSVLGQFAASIQPGSDQAKEIETSLKMSDKGSDQHETGRLRSLKSKTTGEQPRVSSRFEDTPPLATPASSQAQAVATIVLTIGMLALVGGGVYVWMSTAHSNSADTQTSSWIALTKLMNPSRSRGSSDSFGPSVEKQPEALIFSSPDRSKQLTLVDKDHALFTLRGVDMKGTYTSDNSEIVVTPDQQSIPYNYHKNNAGLVDQDGCILYAADAPESMIISKMRQLAVAANRFYRSTGQYPARIDDLLRVDPKLSYTNPFNQQPTMPMKRSLLGYDEQSVDMNLNDFNNMQNAVRQLSIWTPQRSTPGTVEFYRDPSGSEGDMFIVRGTDRTGELLKGSKPGLTYMIVCAAGHGREQ
jgi:tetratricopeptide (TPR) repeat protein